MALPPKNTSLLFCSFFAHNATIFPAVEIQLENTLQSGFNLHQEFIVTLNSLLPGWQGTI
jgi:hypothetical protein